MKCKKPDGAFYLFPNCNAFFGKQYNGFIINSSSDIAEFLLKEALVAVVPGIAFGAKDNIRISFALDFTLFKKAIGGMQNALKLLN